MGFTEHCDLFASFHENGFNRILRHIIYQRPSLFNYATKDVANKPELLCRPIVAHPRLSDPHGNPLMTIEKPLKLPGTNYAINFAVQLVDLKVDFHPGSSINLPPELQPLPEQRLAFGLTVCAGVGCPPADVVDKLIPPPPEPNVEPPPEPEEPIVIPADRLLCTCLDAFAVGGVRFAPYWQQWYLEPFVDRIEITEIRPEDLEAGVECIVDTTLRLGLVPKLRILLGDLTFELTKQISISLQPKPVAESPQIPKNPAVEADELKAFIDLDIHLCPDGQHWDEHQQKCVCPDGQHWDEQQQKCVDNEMELREVS
jgi:hypothetical protein